MQKPSRHTGVIALVISLLLCIQAGYIVKPWLLSLRDRIVERQTEAGQSAPLDVVLITDTSGPTQFIGKDMGAGFEDAIRAGGADRDGRMEIRNDEGRAAAAVALAQGSASGFHTLAIVGPTEAMGFAGVRDAANEGAVVALAPIGNPTETGNGDWTFTLQPEAFKNGYMLGRMVQRITDGPQVVQLVAEGTSEEGFWNGLVQSYKDVASRSNVAGAVQTRLAWPADPTPSAVDDLISRAIYSDAIVVSLPMDAAVIAVKQLREFGYAGPIMTEGESSLEFFAQRFKDEPRETLKLGYYTDGIVSLVPFTPSVASSESQRLINIYRAGHDGNDPSWAYAYGHDAGLLISSFIADQKAQGTFTLENPGAMQQALQKFLKTLNGATRKTTGFTGALDFAAGNQRNISPRLVAYGERQQIPYPIQISNAPRLPLSTRRNPDAIRIETVEYPLIPVVRVGMNIRELSNVNFDTGTFEAAVDIWFKSATTVQIEDFLFLNQVGALKSATIENEQRSDDVSYRRYLVRGTFRFNPSPSDLILDGTSLPISLRHRTLTQEQLTFVVDPEMYRRDVILLSAGSQDGWVDGFRLNRSVLAVDDRTDKALGNPTGNGGALTYSIANFRVDLKRNTSTVTSQLVSSIGAEDVQRLFVVLAVVALIGAVLLLGRPRLSIEACYIILVILALIFSETALFTATTSYVWSVEFLSTIRHGYDFMLICTIARGLDIAALIMMGTRRTGGPVQPVVMFFLRFTLYLGALAVFYTGVLGRDILAILATTSVVLTVVGLALRELIFDAVAGIAIAADDDLKVGLWINIRARDRSLTGVIDHLGWRALCIRSRDGVLHYVPNSIVATQALSNLLPTTGSTRLEIPFIMDARADVTTILPRLTKAVNDEIAELEGVDADKSMRVVIESLENDKIRCVVQVYYSQAFSTDTLRTKVLDRIRRELIASKALSSSRTVMPAQSASPFIAQVYRS